MTRPSASLPAMTVARLRSGHPKTQSPSTSRFGMSVPKKLSLRLGHGARVCPELIMNNVADAIEFDAAPDWQ